MPKDGGWWLDRLARAMPRGFVDVGNLDESWLIHDLGTRKPITCGCGWVVDCIIVLVTTPIQRDIIPRILGTKLVIKWNCTWAQAKGMTLRTLERLDSRPQSPSWEALGKLWWPPMVPRRASSSAHCMYRWSILIFLRKSVISNSQVSLLKSKLVNDLTVDGYSQINMLRRGGHSHIAMVQGGESSDTINRLPSNWWVLLEEWHGSMGLSENRVSLKSIGFSVYSIGFSI